MRPQNGALRGQGIDADPGVMASGVYAVHGEPDSACGVWGKYTGHEKFVAPLGVCAVSLGGRLSASAVGLGFERGCCGTHVCAGF